MNTQKDSSRLHDQNTNLKAVLEDTHKSLKELLGVLTVRKPGSPQPARPLIVEPSPPPDKSAPTEIESWFSAVVEGLIFYDRDGKIIRINAAAERILQFSSCKPGTPFGTHLTSLTIRKPNGEKFNQEESPARRALLGETVRNLVVEIQSKNSDSVTWVSINSAPVRDSAGTVTGAVSSFVDITELIQAEAEIRSAKEEADRANTAKSEFLAHMSHEIRTPLGGILGLTDVLRTRLRNVEDQSFLKMISDSAKSLLGIISDILDLSRIESGKLELSCVDFNPRDELRTLVGTFSIPAGEKGLTIGLSVSDSIPDIINGDPERLRQVVRNLVSNAIKYTDRGRINVTAEVSNRKDKNLELLFSVSDTGIGIPEEKQHLLFKEFMRLGNVKNRKEGQGAGLGLAISRHIITMMGGTIKVESAPGKGSTFIFTAVFTMIDEKQKSGPEKQHEQNVLSTLPKLRILLAEDNRINQLFLKTILEQGGHTVITADNGKTAVECVESSFRNGSQIDAVLMDIQMPEMDGVEATKIIRTLPGAASEIAIVALTAFAMKGDRDHFLESGMDGYVTKPVDFKLLAQELKRVCLGK